MKAIISPVSLLKELKKMSLVVQKNTVLPILKSVKFDFQKGKVKITATDLETTYISTIDCECPKPFLLLMEFTDIVDICSAVSLPLEITVGDTNILLVSGKSKYKLSLLNEAQHFPEIPEDQYYLDFEVDNEFFYYLSIANTFKGIDNPRFNMAAIDIQKKDITIVGTDSNSLYKKEMPIALGKQLTIMVTNNFITACKNFQSGKISIGEKFIKAEYKDEIVISRLSEQKFPDYRVVIKEDIEYNLTANRTDLKSAISSVSFTANTQYKQVVASFTNDNIKFNAQNIDLIKEGETEMEVENTVSIPEIGFNADKLNHFLNTLTCDSIDFSFSSASGSIYFKPSDDETIFCLLQPVVIQTN